MPEGPQGQMRPADVIGNAVHIAKIVTGEVGETGYKLSAKVKSARAWAKARAESMPAEERSDGAKKAVAGRWG